MRPFCDSNHTTDNNSPEKLDNPTSLGDTYLIETKHTNGIKIMKSFTKAQFKKSIKETMAKYSFLSLDDVVKQMSKQYPDSFQAIASAELDLRVEAMGL